MLNKQFYIHITRSWMRFLLYMTSFNFQLDPCTNKHTQKKRWKISSQLKTRSYHEKLRESHMDYVQVLVKKLLRTDYTPKQHTSSFQPHLLWWNLTFNKNCSLTCTKGPHSVTWMCLLTKNKKKYHIAGFNCLNFGN